MFNNNKYTHLKGVKSSCSTVIFINFKHIFKIVLVLYCRLYQLGSLNLRIYSKNKDSKLQWNFFIIETGTERCSLKIAVHKFSK